MEGTDGRGQRGRGEGAGRPRGSHTALRPRWGSGREQAEPAGWRAGWGRECGEKGKGKGEEEGVGSRRGTGRRGGAGLLLDWGTGCWGSGLSVAGDTVGACAQSVGAGNSVRTETTDQRWMDGWTVGVSCALVDRLEWRGGASSQGHLFTPELEVEPVGESGLGDDVSTVQTAEHDGTS